MNGLVLVFPADILEDLGRFQGYTLNVEKYLSVILNPQNNRFMPRTAAEDDPSFKQLIPYVILRNGRSVFSYVRGKQSGEARLIALRSIGIGGHIEPHDLSLFSSDKDFYLQAAKREVNEEVRVDSDYRERVVALINDDSNDVGRVHFGIVHIWDLTEPSVTKREGKITQSGFVEIQQLKGKCEELETWSRFALQVLEDSRIKI